VTQFDRGVVAEFRANGGWGFVRPGLSRRAGTAT
jgi:hypothetical protein